MATHAFLPKSPSDQDLQRVAKSQGLYVAIDK
jgi:hypothetical protein